MFYGNIAVAITVEQLIPTVYICSNYIRSDSTTTEFSFWCAMCNSCVNILSFFFFFRCGTKIKLSDLFIFFRFIFGEHFWVEHLPQNYLFIKLLKECWHWKLSIVKSKMKKKTQKTCIHYVKSLPFSVFFFFFVSLPKILSSFLQQEFIDAKTT